MIVESKNWSRSELDGDGEIQQSVSEIISKIKTEGDPAIDYYADKFDGIKPRIIELKDFSEYPLDTALANSIQLAAKRIEKFARFQKDNGLKDAAFSDDYGNYGQRVLPLESIGAYIPGGRHPLISTALMTLIPAKIAGCEFRIACSPSDHPALLAAASLAGATKFVQIGGVQAIASLAYGYAGELPVNAIVGPGNAWVNEAKKQVQSAVKIDGLAGPSELLAICDESTPIDWLALDALAQAEHDPMACSVIISDGLQWLKKMETHLSHSADTRGLIENQQIELILCDTKQAMVDFSNQYAPEHLMLCDKNIDADQLINYGSLFIGANSAVALGDYISGPNHTLPTLGYAKQTGGLSVSCFQKVVSFQQLNGVGTAFLSNKALPIAKAEGLEFHCQSLKIRMS